jgi:hypothetical protein
MVSYPFTIPARDKLIWAAVDLDGTLAQPVWPDPGIGEPIRLNVVKVRELHRAGYKVVIHTARGSEAYELIEAWLNHHDIPWSRIVTGKVLAAVYIDDRALNADASSWIPR